MSGRRAHRYGLLVTLLGVIILLPDTLVIRLVEAEQEVDAFSLTFWRGTLLFIGMMTLYQAVEGPRALRQALGLGRWALAVAALMSLQGFTFVVALKLTTVANTLLIVSTAPLFAAFLSWVFLGERTPLRTWLVILAALVGIGIIFSGSLSSTGDPRGDLAALVTALGIGASFTVIRHKRDVNMIPASALGHLIAAMIALPLASPFIFTPYAFALLLLLGLIILPVSFGLIIIGPRYIPAPEVSLLLLLETVLAPVLVWLAIGEEPSTLALTGGAVVVTALLLHALLALRRDRV